MSINNSQRKQCFTEIEKEFKKPPYGKQREPWISSTTHGIALPITSLLLDTMCDAPFLYVALYHLPLSLMNTHSHLWCAGATMFIIQQRKGMRKNVQSVKPGHTAGCWQARIQHASPGLLHHVFPDMNSTHAWSAWLRVKLCLGKWAEARLWNTLNARAGMLNSPSLLEASEEMLFLFLRAHSEGPRGQHIDAAGSH